MPSASKKKASAAPGRLQFSEFLRSEHIGKVGDTTTLKLSGFNRRKPNGTFGPEIVMDVADKSGHKYDFSIREGSPNHRMMFDAFGDDERTWKGSIQVEVIENERSGRAFVAITDVRSNRAPF